MLIGQISQTYGLAATDLLVSTGNKRLAIPVGNEMLFGFVVNNELDNKPAFTFSYDSFVTNRHLLLSQQLPVTYTSPALDFTMAVPLETVLGRVRTNSSLVKGKKWNEIEHHTVPVTPHNLLEFFKHKQASYSTANSAHEIYLAAQGYTGFLTTGFLSKTGEFLYTLLWYTNYTDTCGTHIVVTQDPALKKKYSPYIVGHLWLVREAYRTKVSACRFSLYYPYKQLFGIPATMYPTLPVESLLSLGAQEF